MQPNIDTPNNPYDQMDSSRTEQQQVGYNIQQTQQQWINQNQLPQQVQVGQPIQQQYWVGQPMQQQQWVGQNMQMMPVQQGVLLVQQIQKVDDVVLRTELLAQRKCLLIYLSILFVLDTLQFIGDISMGNLSYWSIIGMCLCLLMIYGVYSCNYGLITLGLVLCYIGIVLLIISLVFVIIALMILIPFANDPNAIIDIDGQQVTDVGTFIAIYICLVLIPLSVALIIEILLIINYGRLRNRLVTWKLSHGGLEFKPQEQQ